MIAFAYEPEGRVFESPRAHYLKPIKISTELFLAHLLRSRGMLPIDERLMQRSSRPSVSSQCVDVILCSSPSRERLVFGQKSTENALCHA